MNPTQFPLCSILIVNYNGKPHLDRCLLAFEQLRYPSDRIELFVIDNGSEDGSEIDAQAAHPQLRLLRNTKNNFAAALNLGISQAQGAFVAFANNDVFVEPDWLFELIRVLQADERAGCAGGKILFENGRINSVGHQALPDFYWQDEGFNEVDRGQYDREREVEGHSWAAVLFRKSCLDDVGAVDEDFVMYFEDVDFSRRCLQLHWKILYTPRALAMHVFHGSSQGSSLAEFFCDRNRLLYVAKHHPEKLAWAVETSRLLARPDRQDVLYDNLPVALKKLAEHRNPGLVKRVLEKLCDTLVPIYGPLAVEHLLRRMQVILGYRKISVGIYDHALHLIGGGQKYGCTIASALQQNFEVTFIANRQVRLKDLENWYRLSLSRCHLENIPLPFFDEPPVEIDPRTVPPEVANPFAPVAAESQRFDVFVNVNQLTLIRPWSPLSIFLCHFPDTSRQHRFAVHEYSCLVVNSRYTGEWARKLWGLEPTVLLYPPVDMAGPPREKENVILSVARFEIGGSKKQLEMIEAFSRLRASHPDLLRGWRLLLVGGSTQGNPYLQKVIRVAVMRSAQWGEAGVSAPLIEVKVNVPFSELQDLYARAKIFWHACGLGETDPHLIEHFGMTTVEAMQNRCVPIVIDGGGQREIVDHGKCGYRFATVPDLCRYTVELMESPDRMLELQEAACKRAQTFSRKSFERFIHEFFQRLEAEYRTVPIPDPRDVLEGRNRTNIFYSALARRRDLLGCCK